MKKLTCVLMFIVYLSGCDQSNSVKPDRGVKAGAEPAALASHTLSANQLRLWSASCVLCHVNGEGGAPRVGNLNEWSPRMKQGTNVLLLHTLEGFNNMPPLGYCMACEEDDFVALIEFMGGAQ